MGGIAVSKRMGARTVCLTNRPGVIAWASVVGQKEKDGPYGGQFDVVIPNELNGEQSFEAAERSILETAVKLCAQHAGCTLGDVQMLLAGDLLNQIISAGFAARNLEIPFYGLYGACSTMSESLSIGSMIADGGFADRLICSTCSHFCTAERQYRAPLELGNQRTPTAQWTVTGSGAVMLSGGPAAQQAKIVATHTTCGKVLDLGIADQNNMGAAMAPAAADTIEAHFKDTQRGFDDFDLVVTGDLGHLGRDLLLGDLCRLSLQIRFLRSSCRQRAHFSNDFLCAYAVSDGGRLDLRPRRAPSAAWPFFIALLRKAIKNHTTFPGKTQGFRRCAPPRFH